MTSKRSRIDQKGAER